MKTNVIGTMLWAAAVGLIAAEPSDLRPPRPLAQIAVGSTAPQSTDERDASQAPTINLAKRPSGQTFSSLDVPKASEPKEIAEHGLSFQNTELDHVLNLYQELSGRTVVRSLNLPNVHITIRNESALSRREALQTLDSALAGCGVAMVISGTSMVKAVPASQAPMESGPIIDWVPERLPDCGTFIVYIVHTKENQMPRHLAPALQPFAKLPNSILAIDQANMLVIRDYSSNVRQMLQLLDRIGPTPMEDNFDRGLPGQPRDGIPRGPARPRLPAAPKPE
jgi:type II secretory pathway component GspD/PulD (secretin)